MCLQFWEELNIGRIPKVSDLIKEDLKNFSIGLVEARKLRLTKNDLKGIKEIIPNKKYKIRTTTGNRKAITFYGNLLEAIKKRKELETEKTINKESDLWFKEGVELYLEDCYDREKRGDIDINTIYDHIRKLNNDIIPFFSKYKILDISVETIESFLRYMRNRDNKVDSSKKLSERTVSDCYTTLNIVFNFFKKKLKIINGNPCEEATNKPSKKRYHKRELNYFQIKEAIYALKCLDKFANIRLKCFIYIIFSLGCRREECAGLRWKDINFETYEVNYNYAVTSSVPKKYVKERVRVKALKTDNSYRTNFLSEKAIFILKKYYQFKINLGFEINEDDFIFTNWESNTPVDPNKMSEQWRNFKKEYHIKDVDLHRIRHTVANILEKKGIPKKDIAKFLGNTERVLEEFYTHVDIEELKKMRNTIDDTLFNEVDFIELNIDLIVKIINEYPMGSMDNDDLIKLDSFVEEKITESNYYNCIKNIKNAILKDNIKLTYFIDNDVNELNIKLDTYKYFNDNKNIKVKRVKDISIKADFLSF